MTTLSSVEDPETMTEIQTNDEGFFLSDYVAALGEAPRKRHVPLRLKRMSMTRGQDFTGHEEESTED